MSITEAKDPASWQIGFEDGIQFAIKIFSQIPDKKAEDDILLKPVYYLDLLDRSQRCLWAENIETVGDLMKKTIWDLRKIPNCGSKSINDIKVALAKHGLSLEEGKV